MTRFETMRTVCFAVACLLIGACTVVKRENFPLLVEEAKYLRVPDQEGIAGLTFPSQVVAVAWSSDSSRIAAASDFGSVLSIWDASGRLVNSFDRRQDGPELGKSIAFVEGNKQLIFPANPVPRGHADYRYLFGVWDVTAGNVIRRIDRAARFPDSDVEYQLSALNFAVDSDNFRIVIEGPGCIIVQHSCDTSNPAPDVGVYNATNWQLTNTYQTQSIGRTGESLAIFFHGTLAAVGSSDGTVTVVHLDGEGPLERWPVYKQARYDDVPVGAVAGSPDGTAVFAAPSWTNSAGVAPARVIRTTDGALLKEFAVAVPAVLQAAWDPKGRFVAFVDNRRHLFLWNPFAPSLSYAEVNLSSDASSLAIAPSGDKIAVSTAGGVTVFSVR